MAWISSLLRKNPQFMEQLPNIQGRGIWAAISKPASDAMQQTATAPAESGDDEVSLLGGRLRLKKSALLSSAGGWVARRILRTAALANNTQAAAQNNNQEGA